jgi:TatD DNase family protein
MTDIGLIDTHCHLDFHDFDADRAEVIQQAQTSGVNNLVIPAVAQSSWQQTIKVCMDHTQCHLALGMHPIFIEQHQPQHLTELNTLVEQQPAIAIGEIGLDFYAKSLNPSKQKIFFEKQLLIAQRHNLPVIIHNRKAHDECIGILKKFDIRGGIIHAFNGSYQHAKKYIEMGFMLGFGGMLTHARSRKLHGLAEAIPLSSIVLETDAPDMTIEQFRGSRNQPQYLLQIAQSLALIKGRTVDEIAAATSDNAIQSLNLKCLNICT